MDSCLAADCASAQEAVISRKVTDSLVIIR
jgi:hypothetical protein